MTTKIDADRIAAHDLALQERLLLIDASFVKTDPSKRLTAKDRILAAILSLLDQHDASKIRSDSFAGSALHANAVTVARENRMHALQLMVTISRLDAMSPRMLIVASEPPLHLEVMDSRYVFNCRGGAIQSHQVNAYVARMLARALTLFWAECRMDPREAATELLPPATVALHF